MSTILPHVVYHQHNPKCLISVTDEAVQKRFTVLVFVKLVVWLAFVLLLEPLLQSTRNHSCGLQSLQSLGLSSPAGVC